MIRMFEMLQTAIYVISTLAFVYAVLEIMAGVDKKIVFPEKYNLLSLAGIVILSTCLIIAPASNNKCSGICSIGILLVIAIIDESTGFVYDIWNHSFLLLCAVYLLFGFPGNLTQRDIKIIIIYLVTVILLGLFRGIGAGDVPLYLALMLFYLRTTAFPADAAISLLVLSFGLGILNGLLQRKKWLPLAPAIWFAHLITICVWVN